MTLYAIGLCTRPVEKVTPTRCCINAYTSIGYLFPAYFGTHMHTHPPNVVIKSAGKCQIALFYIDGGDWLQGKSAAGPNGYFVSFLSLLFSDNLLVLKAGFMCKKLIKVKHLC